MQLIFTNSESIVTVLKTAVTALEQGFLIAYPTEAVFGIGCDPDSELAVHQLLELKQRPIEKGLILVAASPKQLESYVDFSALDKQQLETVLSSWPGPNTWVMPKKPATPAWLTGQFNTLAVRVSAHPQVQALCLAYGKPIVSTSANLTGHPPGRSKAEVEQALGERLAYIVDGAVDLNANPTQIRDARTGQLIRA